MEKSVSSFNFDGLYLFPEHEQVKIYSEEKKFLFETIRTERNNQTIFNRKKCSGIKKLNIEWNAHISISFFQYLNH